MQGEEIEYLAYFNEMARSIKPLDTTVRFYEFNREIKRERESKHTKQTTNKHRKRDRENPSCLDKIEFKADCIYHLKKRKYDRNKPMCVDNIDVSCSTCIYILFNTLYSCMLSLLGLYYHVVLLTQKVLHQSCKKEQQKSILMNYSVTNTNLMTDTILVFFQHLLVSTVSNFRCQYSLLVFNLTFYVLLPIAAFYLSPCR